MTNNRKVRERKGKEWAQLPFDEFRDYVT
jgi:hypothetical protein